MINSAYPKTVIIPTDDVLVRQLLRELDEPMCFFGEGTGERRIRLSKILSKLKPEEIIKLQQSVENKSAVKSQTDNDDEEPLTTYSCGTEALKVARYKIADYSIRKCSERLDMARIRQLEPLSTRLIPKQDLIEKVRKIEDLGSYVDEDISLNELKTITSCSINSDAKLLASSCRSGKCKIWSLPDMETHSSLKGHATNANFITFSPRSGSEVAPQSANLASCSMDGSILLWNLTDETPICQLSDNNQKWRVTRIRYHGSGEYLAACCSDRSWRLYDLASETLLSCQEGHSDSVFDLGFHIDGSLAASAGLDSFARLWDLRTGKSIHLLEGHTAGLRTIDFSPNGFHLATGGVDNSVKIWNLRQRKLEYTIPAHLGLVTTVMFEKKNGFYLATSSFDRTVKFWSSQTWAPVKTLDAYDDKVANFDLSTEQNFLATCYFKYVKLWSMEADGEL